MVAGIFLCFKECIMYQNPYLNSPLFNYNNSYPQIAQPNYYNAQQQNAMRTSNQQQSYVAPPPKTNKILVVSLEDALSKCNEPNCDYMCLDQDKPLLYNVSVDMQGRKAYQTFDITEHKPEEKPQTKSVELKDYVPMTTFSDLQAQFLSLQNRFNDLVERIKSPQNGSNAQSKGNTRQGE